MYLKKEQVIKVAGKRLEYRSTGRTEIIGNHTDHQRGCVIAAAIDRYVTAEVIPGEDGRVTLAQDGFREISFDLSGFGQTTPDIVDLTGKRVEVIERSEHTPRWHR